MEFCHLCVNTTGGECSFTCKEYSCIIDNAVLAYAQSFLENNSVLEVAKALESYFNVDDLTDARDVLRNKFSEQLMEKDIIKIGGRRTTATRSCREASAHDISEAVHALSSEENAPKFVALNVKKLPLLSPTLAVPRSQNESLLLMEKKIQRLEERMTHTDDTIGRHEQQLFERFIAKPDDAIGACSRSSESHTGAEGIGPRLGITSAPPPVALGAWSRPLVSSAKDATVNVTVPGSSQGKTEQLSSLLLPKPNGDSESEQQRQERKRQRRSGEKRQNNGARKKVIVTGSASGT